MSKTAVSCPLCKNAPTVSREVFPVQDLCALYKHQLGVDVSREFPLSVKEISLEKCTKCELEFFNPATVGSPDFYAKLSAQQGYYPATRWEFQQASTAIPVKASVLDVGCGDGLFLNVIPHEKKVGIEYNPAAVSRARHAGLDVQSKSMAEFSPGSFNAVTAFHVLEHVADPRGFIVDALRLVQSGGLLVLSVPNNDGFIGRDIQNALNAPPHHVLRWRPATLSYVTNLFGIDLEMLSCEPLGEEHLFHYRRTRLFRAIESVSGVRLPVIRRSWPTTVLYKTINACVTVWSRISPNLAPSLPPGLSVLAVYRKPRV